MEDILVHLFEFRDNIKLYHFQTREYGAHRASDDLEKKFSEQLDQLMEVLQGAQGKRINTVKTTIRIVSLVRSDKEIQNYCILFLRYLEELSIGFAQLKRDDLVNIVADMEGSIHQFLYLLTFK